MIPSNRRIKTPELPAQAPDAASPSAAERPAKKASRYGTWIRAFIGAGLVIGIAVTVAWAARRHVMSSTRFAVTAVDVTGGHHRTNDEILRASGIALGANIFALDLDDARQKLLGDPWISDATFARRLPSTILVQVTEREAGAIVAMGETYLATRDGEIFKKLEPGDPVDLPIVTGIRSEGALDDREGAKHTVRRAIDLASDYERSSLAKKATLQEIHVGEGGSVTLIIGKTSMAVALGDPPFRKKLEQAAKVLGELDKRGGKADAIMLDNDARPDRVVVRVR